MQAVVTRKIDELGRIVLSAELRNNLNLEAGNEMDIFTDEAGNIALKSLWNAAFCAKGQTASLKSETNQSVPSVKKS